MLVIIHLVNFVLDIINPIQAGVFCYHIYRLEAHNGNLATIATRYVAGAYYLKKAYKKYAKYELDTT